MTEIQTYIKDLDYWTDSPSSKEQDCLLHPTHHHDEIFQARAIWNFLESGHVKFRVTAKAEPQGVLQILLFDKER